MNKFKNNIIILITAPDKGGFFIINIFYANKLKKQRHYFY